MTSALPSPPSRQHWITLALVGCIAATSATGCAAEDNTCEDDSPWRVEADLSTLASMPEAEASVVFESRGADVNIVCERLVLAEHDPNGSGEHEVLCVRGDVSINATVVADPAAPRLVLLFDIDALPKALYFDVEVSVADMIMDHGLVQARRDFPPDSCGGS